ncbi:hypothetical protein [Lentzea sp. NPDC003310]|uniref:hypothetical protein n=1 Tax=Lentzea sp. NPDC003310 TaxID=3154447 RepID=UPI0033B0E707
MDELDDDLRRLFSDDRLDVHSTTVSTEAVLRGADRRRRQRAAVAGSFALVAVVGAGVGLSRLGEPLPDTASNGVLTTGVTTTTTSPPPVSTVISTVTVTVEPPPNQNGGTTSGNPGTKSTPPSKPTSVPPPESQPGQYAKLALGMSEADALATGTLVEPSTPADAENRCKAYARQSVPDNDAVVVSPDRGIVRMLLPSFAKTPKGVGAGSKIADVKIAYGNATQNGSNLVVPMNATPAWSYIFETDGTAVQKVFMRLNANDCSSV